MKSKTRKISVDGSAFIWSASETEWNCVLVKIWIAGAKRNPWITINVEFHNPWNFIGLVTDKNIGNLQFKPVTPGAIARIIQLAIKQFGLPDGDFKQTHAKLSELGTLIDLKSIVI